ncbi:MAG: hypothetical protein MRZ79_01170 [Bacteroidia bacterium]|nr:hypothetical protein [Bacteroidia bacterium]
MINTFLKAKHWQLFLLTFGIPMLAYAFFIQYMMSNFEPMLDPDAVFLEPDPEEILGFFKYVPTFMILFAGILYSWMWSVGVGLKKHILPELRLNVNLFKFFLLVPATYICVIAYFMSYIFNASFFPDPDFEPSAVLILSIVFMHLFSMFCIFFCMHFVAKSIKTAEMGRKVRFSEFAGEFFMIWFYPVGVWILQPRINKIVENPDRV